MRQALDKSSAGAPAAQGPQGGTGRRILARGAVTARHGERRGAAQSEASRAHLWQRRSWAAIEKSRSSLPLPRRVSARRPCAVPLSRSQLEGKSRQAPVLAVNHTTTVVSSGWSDQKCFFFASHLFIFFKMSSGN